MPWLYYEDPVEQIRKDTRITTQFTFPSMSLDFVAAEYTLAGSYLGTKPVTGGLLQLCKESDAVMDAAYSFGTTYEQSVSSINIISTVYIIYCTVHAICVVCSSFHF